MKSVIVTHILSNPPDGWILLDDTSHAFRYAADIWDDEVKRLDLELQHNQFKQLYEEYKKYEGLDLDHLARIAFHIQFFRECIQEIQRLIELSKGSPYE